MGTAGIVTVTPGPLEVAIVHAPPGYGLTVTYDDGTSRNVPAETFPGDFPDDWRHAYHAIPGTGMGWGCWLTTYLAAGAIARGRHKTDRDVWQKATRLLGSIARTHPGEGAVIYLVHEPRDWYGRTVLRAVRIRREGETPAAPAVTVPVTTDPAAVLRARILEHLSHSSGPLSAFAIARVLGPSPSSVRGQLVILEKAGAVEGVTGPREPGASRNATWWQLTPQEVSR